MVSTAIYAKDYLNAFDRSWPTDGFGGGNNISGNILFNFCRDSGDHGPFNSWDRQMWLIKQPDDDGSPSVLPQFNTISHNLMIANYNSQVCG